MTQFLYILGIIFIVVIISVLLLNVKYFIKGEILKKTCASQAGQDCACSAEEQKECKNKLS